MQAIHKKREIFAKENRSRQRNSIISERRQEKIPPVNENQDIIQMIPHIIDIQNDPNNPDGKEDFEAFLDFLSEDVMSANQQEQQKMINKAIIEVLIEKQFGSKLEDFENAILKAQASERLKLIKEPKNSKTLSFIRILFRCQVVPKGHLDIIDALFESTKLAFEKSTQSGKFEENQEALIQELTELIQMKTFLMREVTFLFALAKFSQRSEISEEKKNKIIKKNKSISKLFNKWFLQAPFLEFTSSQKVLKVLSNSKSPLALAFNSLSQKYLTEVLQIIYQDENFIRKIINDANTQNSPEKLLEVIFSLLFILDDSFDTGDIDISESEKKEDELKLLINVSNHLIMVISLEKKQTQESFGKEILLMFINCFNELPKVVVEGFLEKEKTKQLQHYESIKESSNYLVSKRVCEKQPLLTRIFRLIDSLDFDELQRFIGMIANMSFYSDAIIETLLKMPTFEDKSGTKFTFKSKLQFICTGLRCSPLLSASGFQLLLNITGSPDFYNEGFFLIKKLFMENLIGPDFFSALKEVKYMELKDKILRSIINYLCSVKTYQELHQMVDVKRLMTRKEAHGLFKGQFLVNNQQFEQNLLNWSISIAKHVIVSYLKDFFVSEKQHLVQVALYSIYNILTIEMQEVKSSNHTEPQNQPGKMVLNFIEIQQLPKILQDILHQQFQNQSKTFKMLEALIDQLEEAEKQ